MEKILKIDPLSEEEFYPKRINQRFANPENRIKYNNNKATELRHSIAYINKPLHRNFQILNEIMEEKNELVVHKQFMLGKGFSFKVFNHIEPYNGVNEKCIYQYMIISLDSEKLKIIRND